MKPRKPDPTSRPRTAGGWRAVLALTAALTSATPAAAQSGGTVFVDLGRWTIYEMTGAGHCEMRLNAGATGSLVMTKRAGAPGSLRPMLNNPGRLYGDDVVWAFDEEQYDGSVQGRGTFAPSSDSSAIEAAFRKAETLTISQSGTQIATVSLQSSAAGFRLLDQCADQWRSGFFPPRDLRTAAAPQRATTPVREEPRMEAAPPRLQPTARKGPYPPNRAVTPRDAGSWVRREDFDNLPALRGDGILRFSLLVDEEGRVEECTVLSSSGSRQLDGQTCRTLQRRAQFDPATDANGNAIEATYTSEVKFAIPK